MGGADGWLGVDLSQLLQAALFLSMSVSMPGQYIAVMALAVMLVTPWWAERTIWGLLGDHR